MSKSKIKSLKGVTVKFERLDDDDNVVEVIAEKTFPDAEFSYYYNGWNSSLVSYYCWDHAVNDYVYEQHGINDAKYHYEDWDEAPNIRQAFYNGKGELLHWEDEVDYEMGL